MEHFTVQNMLDMQNQLQEKYKGKWEPIGPETGKSKLLWMIAELGEVIDIIKKQGTEHIMQDASTRHDFVEEMADVLMYYCDILNCYGITEAELKKTYEEKFRRNMDRW
ncbi:MAG: nucleotide pyrophosphohydrolase [Clostridia bacterium]|nr:nucleotide pyrophosphohydrolase [Clostridia bacterium]